MRPDRDWWTIMIGIVAAMTFTVYTIAASANDRVTLAALTAWMSGKTDHATPDYAPDIVTKSPREMWWMMYPGQPFPENPDNGRVHGLYINGTIYLSDAIPYGVWRDSVILHELVHHYQADSPPVCLGQMEREAYEVQEQWLKERGVDIWDYLDPLWTISIFTIGCGPQAENFGVR